MTYTCDLCAKKIEDLWPGHPARFFSPQIQAFLHLPGDTFTICKKCMNMYVDQHFSTSWSRCDVCESIVNNYENNVWRCNTCKVCMKCDPTDHFCREMFFRQGVFTFPEYINEHTRHVGLEIEVIDPEFGGNFWEIRGKLWKALPKTISVVHDGSVQGDHDDGFELVTPPIEIDSEKYLLTVSAITKALTEGKFRVNETCGFHVHIDARDIVLDPIKIAHVLRTVYAIEDILFSMNPPSRWHNRFCLPLCENYVFEDFEKPMKLEAFEQYWYTIGKYRTQSLSRDRINEMKSNKYGHAKYSGVNFHSMLYRSTIEFRYHAGTINKEKMMHWASLLHTLVNYAVQHYDDKQVKSLYAMKTSSKKLALMIQTMHISDELAAYMKERVSKWNDKFTQFSMNMEERSVRLRASLEKQRKEKKTSSLRGMSSYFEPQITSWSTTEVSASNGAANQFATEEVQRQYDQLQQELNDQNSASLTGSSLRRFNQSMQEQEERARQQQERERIMRNAVEDQQAYESSRRVNAWGQMLRNTITNEENER